ncbi:MAG: hypothetical protein AAFQ94_05690 [Bacteroidota bacterium]
MRMFIKSAAFIVLFISYSGLLTSQTSAKYLKAKENPKFRKGFIIEDDSSITDGLVRGNLTDDRKLHVFVTFISEDGKKKNYYPWHIKGFGFDKVRFSSDEKSFHKLLISGNLVNLYRGTTDFQVNVASSSAADKTKATEVYYLKKPSDDSFVLVEKDNFKTQMSKYFKDCRTLAGYISEKKLRFRDIRKIVTLYNECD